MVVASLATLVLTTTCSDDATLSLGGEGVVAVSASLVLMTACSDDALSFSEGGDVVVTVSLTTVVEGVLGLLLSWVIVLLVDADAALLVLTEVLVLLDFLFLDLGLEPFSD